MYTKKIIAALFSSLAFCSIAMAQSNSPQANDVKKYQAVCKGQSAGSPVSFAHKGVLWNGSCESQFFPTSKQAVTIDDAQRIAICAENPDAKSAQVNDQELKGKCVMAYLAPQPIKQ